MAAKKPAKKAAKPATKAASVKKSAPAKKPVAKAAAKKVAVKKAAPVKKAVVAKKAAPVKKAAAVGKASPAKTPATKKTAPKAPAAGAKKPTSKAAAPAKKAVSKPVAKAPAAAKQPAVEKKPTVKPVQDEARVKSSQSEPKKQDAGTRVPPSSGPQAPTSQGKVMVAVKKTSSAPAAPEGKKFKVVPYEVDEATGRPIVPSGYKPSPDEEYMNPLMLEYFRQRLLQWRAELVEESKQTIENLKEEVRDIGDEAERATRETENSLELRTRDRYRKLIGKIDSTLKRIDSGEYGYCVDTGEEIGLERMEARLTAERTIDAQERWEHAQKLMGE